MHREIMIESEINNQVIQGSMSQWVKGEGWSIEGRGIRKRAGYDRRGCGTGIAGAKVDRRRNADI